MGFFLKKTGESGGSTRRLHNLSRLILEPLDPKTAHTVNLTVAAGLLATILWILYFLGVFSPGAPPIAPNELDLSGPWKLSLKDSPKFSSPNFDDSKWCFSGVPDPRLWKENKNNLNCDKDFYPAEKMRGHTYWYRKLITISETLHLKEPSLFFGAIKHKAWIYWDGKLIGITDFKNGTGISTVQLDPSLIKAGTHLLALKVSSLETRYPGIFHAYPRKVALGETSGNASQFKRIIDQRYIYPSVTLFMQATGLLLTILLLSLGRGSGIEFFWLSIYFFGTASASFEKLVSSELHLLIIRLSLVVTSFAVLGFSLKFYRWLDPKAHLISRILVFVLLTFTSTLVILHFQDKIIGPTAHRLIIATAIVPFVAFLIFAAIKIGSTISQSSKKKTNWADALSLTIIGSLHALNVANEFVFFNTPINTGQPALKAALTIGLLATMIYQYTKQERTLAFYGRFIRPGLKTLLEEKVTGSTYSDGKFFRARKVAIMKIDIVGHTQTTFQMPFGMKRLFQDTWFTVVDQVVAHKVFMDKNVGDGSIYCFLENGKESSCDSALGAAMQIADIALVQFDKIYLERMQKLIELTPEIRGPAKKFFDSYRNRTNSNFKDRKSNIRIALVYGFVDEGLWGLSSQSHYDVQGDLVSLAARIESKAETNEILMSESFFDEVKGRLGDKKISPRLVTLKGMGEVKVFGLCIKQGSLKKAA